MQTSTRTALITGASSGIGEAFARRLAAQGFNLVLVARRVERLVALAAELQQNYEITAEPFMADLSVPGEVDQLEAYIRNLSNLELLVNNAGFGTTGRFVKIDLAKQLEMIQVHLIATMRLCRAALPAMISRNRGCIINVSSIGAFAPSPGNVTYNATKAFLVPFSEGLQIELWGTRVQVQALCPGFTYTDFHARSEYAMFNRLRIPRWLWSSPDVVVAESLHALDRGQVLCIPGFKNRLLIAFFRLLSALLRNPLTAPLLKARSAPVLQWITGERQ